MDLFGERLIGRLVFINERGSGAYLSVSRLEVWNLIKGFQYLTPVLKRPPQDNKTKKRFTQNAQNYHWRANMNKAMHIENSEVEISSLPSCLVLSLKRNFRPLWVFNVFRRPLCYFSQLRNYVSLTCHVINVGTLGRHITLQQASYTSPTVSNCDKALRWFDKTFLHDTTWLREKRMIGRMPVWYFSFEKNGVKADPVEYWMGRHVIRGQRDRLAYGG